MVKSARSMRGKHLFSSAKNFSGIVKTDLIAAYLYHLAKHYASRQIYGNAI